MRIKATLWGLLAIGLLLGGCGPAPGTDTPAANSPSPTKSPTQAGPDLGSAEAAAVQTGTAAMALTHTAFRHNLPPFGDFPLSAEDKI